MNFINYIYRPEGPPQQLKSPTVQEYPLPSGDGKPVSVSSKPVVREGQKTRSEPKKGSIEMESLKPHLPSVYVNGKKPIPRPDKGGTLGRPIALRANFFRMSVNRDVTVEHYDVAITPEIKAKAKIREVIKVFVKSNPVVFKNIYPVFDGVKNLYTHCRLSFGNSLVR